MAQENNVEQDLSHIHWSWPEAIAANPARSLATADLAMDYFAYSPFFDTNSNNSVLRTQRRVENPAYGHAEEKIELNAFRSGFEYIIAHSQPPELFVVHRRTVQPDGTRSAISAAYFILQEKIYPTPTLYGVMSARLRNASHLVSTTFSTLSAAHPPANPRATSQWRSLPPSAPGQPDSAVPAPGAAEDVEMADSSSLSAPGHETSGTASSSAPRKRVEAKQPDFHLFNALQSTRIALGDLENMAASPAQAIDPRDELRALEAQIMGKQKGTAAARGGAGQGQGQAGKVGVGLGSAGTPSVRMPLVGSSPGVSMVGGRAMSTATGGMGQSPSVYNQV